MFVCVCVYTVINMQFGVLLTETFMNNHNMLQITVVFEG